jgi:predicted nucleic acid-binding protein
VKPLWVDANVLLRLLTNDPPAMADKAAALAERAERGEILLRVAPLVVAEVVWVLQSFYGHDRRLIADALTSLLTAQGVEAVDGKMVISALEAMAANNVDFVDAYLAQLSCATREAVCSFDEDFPRLGVELLMPD